MRIAKIVPVFASLALVLVATLPAVPALADDTAVITVQARGAALGQRAVVQWGDSIGGWHTVDGWQGTLDHITPQGVPFASFTVFSNIFGQGPFRWVVYFPDGVTVWTIGPNFWLPTTAGQNYVQPLDQQTPTPGALATPTPVAPGVPTYPATGEPLLNGHTFTYGEPCNCNASKITVLIGGLPSSVWIAVQWQDAFGWHTVAGWQGYPTSVSPQGVLTQQWNIGPELFGSGPFRWAVYDYDGGPLIGVSPNFNMPATSRLNLYMSMAPY